MKHYLIVANQTLGGEKLEREVQERIGEGDSDFHIVVPMTLPKHETRAWPGGFRVHEGMTPSQIAEAAHQVEEEAEEQARRHEALVAEARRRAEHRLDQMIGEIKSAGGQASGEVGDADPAAAVHAVLQAQAFDEVIVSTLPRGLSRWLKMDLPSRVARMTDVPVTTVEADH